MAFLPDARTAVVVAHPDDETLWLSSVLAAAERVVLCFGDPAGRPRKARARARAVAALPLKGLVNLALPESGAGFAVDWAHPRPTATGIAVTAAGSRYDANYAALAERLRPALAGVSHVFTHNPWGEYGHAEHVQVHRAVAALQAEMGYTLWFSNYVGIASWPLARLVGAQPCWSAYRAVAPDRSLALRLRDIYRRHGAWTWTRWHRWPARETLYAQVPGDAPRHPMTGRALLDVSALRLWSAWRDPLRRLE